MCTLISMYYEYLCVSTILANPLTSKETSLSQFFICCKIVNYITWLIFFHFKRKKYDESKHCYLLPTSIHILMFFFSSSTWYQSKYIEQIHLVHQWRKRLDEECVVKRGRERTHDTSTYHHVQHPIFIFLVLFFFVFFPKTILIFC